jgi:hypothetical protein
VHPKVDVGHAIMILELLPKQESNTDPGWDTEISMRQTCVSLHHQRANANVGGTNSPRSHSPISSLARHGHRPLCLRQDEGTD